MSQRERTLAALREAGEAGVTSLEFVKTGCGLRYGARIQELRAEGYEIDVARIGSEPTVYRYTLKSAPPVPARPEGQELVTDRQPDGWVSASSGPAGTDTLFQLDEPSATVSAITGKKAA